MKAWLRWALADPFTARGLGAVAMLASIFSLNALAGCGHP